MDEKCENCKYFTADRDYSSLGDCEKMPWVRNLFGTLSQNPVPISYHCQHFKLKVNTDKG